MEEKIQRELEKACWVAHALFDRGKVTGSTSNLSFRLEDRIYISRSGGCFGTMQPEDFSCVGMDGQVLSGPKPSKEWPLHIAVYEKSPLIGAVLHTHSTYGVLWSCLSHENESDCIPAITPYLGMKLGKVGLVPYAKPGSPELFSAFREKVGGSDGWLLKQHGPVVPGKDIMDAFYNQEELEESCKIAWMLRND